MLVYGFAALIWKLTICVSLLIAASTMFAGAGVLIAALAGCLWFARPISQLVTFGHQLQRQDHGRFVRAIVVGSSLLAGLWLMVWQLPIPTAVTVPAVAAYLPETLVRSGADGFVRAIHVHDSVYVRKGDLLLELENRELQNQLRRLELAAQQNEIRRRQASQEHDAARQLVLHDNQIALHKQLTNLRAQEAGLRVIAPRDGHVLARDLALKMGTYAHEGDPLLLVTDQNEKELIAVISQDAISSARLTLGGPVWIRDASSTLVRGRLDRIDPRATDRIPDESLAASEGGPLAVRGSSENDDKDDSNQSYRLLAPHFQGRIDVAAEAAGQIPAGMRLTASLGYRRDPLATRVRAWVRRLWHEAQDRSRR